ncbi:22472_t:CDS:1, partial [Racocetra persica]
VHVIAKNLGVVVKNLMKQNAKYKKKAVYSASTVSIQQLAMIYKPITVLIYGR